MLLIKIIKLVGHIQFRRFSLEAPTKRISSFMHANEFVAHADEDRENIAKRWSTMG